MIDILIPTYNRAEFLLKNITLLNEFIIKSSLQNDFRIIVSDNCSTDNTAKVLKELKDSLSIELETYRQERNIGLEPNVVFLLKRSTADYIMYLGDDDYLPDGYIDFVVDKTKNETLSCIIPGFSSLYPDGEVKPARSEAFKINKYEPGYSTVCKLSNFGHQLSGLVTKREGLYETYLNSEVHRNIYPFIFFVTYCMLRGVTYYAPVYQVLVSQGNSKDWRYDESGLLADVFKNYRIAFPDQPFKSAFASINFARIQNWRLRIGKNPALAFKALVHLTRASEMSILVKISLFFLYPYLYVRKGTSYLRKQLKIGRLV